MSDINWNLISGLAAFIVFLLLLRDTERPRMSDRRWIRRQRLRSPHHTTIRRDTQDYWECSTGRCRIP